MRTAEWLVVMGRMLAVGGRPPLKQTLLAAVEIWNPPQRGRRQGTPWSHCLISVMAMFVSPPPLPNDHLDVVNKGSGLKRDKKW